MCKDFMKSTKDRKRKSLTVLELLMLAPSCSIVYLSGYSPAASAFATKAKEMLKSYIHT